MIYVGCSETQQGIFDAVLKGHIDFESDPWPLISESAKDLIRKMLCMHPADRATAHQVLSVFATLSLISYFPLRMSISNPSACATAHDRCLHYTTKTSLMLFLLENHTRSSLDI